MTIPQMSNFSFLDEPTTAVCPYCGQPMQLTAELAGQTVACPSCHAQIAIPADEPPRKVAPVRRPAGKDKQVVGAAMMGATGGALICGGAFALYVGQGMQYTPTAIMFLLIVLVSGIAGAGFVAGIKYLKD